MHITAQQQNVTKPKLIMYLIVMTLTSLSEAVNATGAQLLLRSTVGTVVILVRLNEL